MTHCRPVAGSASDETPSARLRRAESCAQAPLSRCRARRGQAGVTLVEVLIVVAIMAMLGGSVGFYALQQYKKAALATALEDARSLRKAVELWQVQNNEDSCPTMSQLVADKQINSDSHQVDPWGTEWSISCADGEIYVQSSGPDKKPGTPDDIRVPKQQTSTEG